MAYEQGIGIALDIGTSGIRAQSVDLGSGRIMGTSLTTRHPLPGANVIDHLQFALEIGISIAQKILVRTVNRIVASLQAPKERIRHLAVCGNPTQLSIFQGMDICDLAFAGTRKRKSIGVDTLERNARTTSADRIHNLDLPPQCRVTLPPAIRHEVGADALAMIILSGMMERKQTALAVDFGTNAEMALFHENKIITASTAAGPALEGGHIECGILAVPGAIVDVAPEASGHRLYVLTSDMTPAAAGLVDLSGLEATQPPDGPAPVGITGTGTLAMVQQASESGLIDLPSITTKDNRLHAGEGISFSETDLHETGKAVGALRAGQLALCHAAGIGPGDIQTVYMAGASGTYMDPIKAQYLGMIPPRIRTVYQIGNTSLAAAKQLLLSDTALEQMKRLASRLRETHYMLAGSKVFEQLFILELSYWNEGMPMALYKQLLKRYGLPDLPRVRRPEKLVRTVRRDIDQVGRLGVKTISEIGGRLSRNVSGCTSCLQCVSVCPEKAITVESSRRQNIVQLFCSRCNGVSCRRCETACPEKVLVLDEFFREC